MGDPLKDERSTMEALQRVLDAAGPYLEALPERLVWDRANEGLLAELTGPLPENGTGTLEAVEELLRVGTATATASAGPRFFHFVIGGSAPAALAADWTVSLLDQNAFVRASSRLADTAETVALGWLRELVGLPPHWGGALTASATFANLTGLALATHWWAERQGVDATAHGLTGLPRMPVLGGGHVHPSARKALQMLGHGRDTVEIFTRDDTGGFDVDAVARRLGELDGAPAVLIGTAGEPNAGAFDPVADLAGLAEQHGAWLHIDGAFGIFAALSPRTAHLTAGMDRADSIAADAHKWLNVPYESGFALVREPERLGRAFGFPGAAYLPGPDDPRGGYGLLGPESSRRARALPIWATLAAYGRSGYRELVERHCDLAAHLAAQVDAAADMERLADVPLNVVCFRYRPPGLPEPALDEINRRLGEALLDDGRVFAGTTVYRGKVALRPAISNWRTTTSDIDLLLEVVEIWAREPRRPADRRPDKIAAAPPGWSLAPPHTRGDSGAPSWHDRKHGSDEMAPDMMLTPIGRVRSELVDRGSAPKQGDEGAPEAWLELEPSVGDGLRDLAPGAEMLLLTWLDRARRDVLVVHPRGDVTRPETGVFNTRSPDRPNPIGLHRVTIVAIEGSRLRVSALEALDGTPVLDLKPVLDPLGER